MRARGGAITERVHDWKRKSICQWLPCQCEIYLSFIRERNARPSKHELMCWIWPIETWVHAFCSQRFGDPYLERECMTYYPGTCDLPLFKIVCGLWIFCNILYFIYHFSYIVNEIPQNLLVDWQITLPLNEIVESVLYCHLYTFHI